MSKAAGAFKRRPDGRYGTGRYGIRSVMQSEARPGLLEAWGAFIFRRRNLVFPLAIGVLLVAFPPRLPWDDPGSDGWMDAAGVAAVVAGSALRFLVSGLAEIRLGGLGKRVHAETLHTDGLFAHCRNPLYVANLLIVFGLFLILNNPWIWVLGGAFFLASYRAIVATEERYLAARFGDEYEAYRRRVPRWAIDPRGLGRTLSAMAFDWGRAVVKEYSPLATNGLALAVVLGWDAVAERGVAGSLGALIACAAFLVSLLALCHAARRYKKSGRYRARRSV